jgi:uncharacterized protein YdaT
VIVPWSKDRYPPAMGSLKPETREKAIEIANSILSESADEGKAIRVGIAKAKEWETSHGRDTKESLKGTPKHKKKTG